MKFSPLDNPQLIFSTSKISKLVREGGKVS